MKAVVFDNSGTLIKRYRAIKDLRNGVICDNVNSIDVVDHDNNRALVVLQTDPSKCIHKARPDQTIWHFLNKNNVKFDVSYSDIDIGNEELLEAIKNDKSYMRDVQDTYKSVVEKKYNVHICSGSGFIVNMASGHIEFTITAGGRIFKEVPYVINELKKEISKFLSLQEIEKYRLSSLRIILISLLKMCMTQPTPEEKVKL